MYLGVTHLINPCLVAVSIRAAPMVTTRIDKVVLADFVFLSRLSSADDTFLCSKWAQNSVSGVSFGLQWHRVLNSIYGRFTFPGVSGGLLYLVMSPKTDNK